MCLWNGQAVLLDSFEVKFNRFMNQLGNFRSSLANCYAAGKVWHISAETGWRFFDDDEILRLRPRICNQAPARKQLVGNGFRDVMCQNRWWERLFGQVRIRNCTTNSAHRTASNSVLAANIAKRCTTLL